MTNASETVQVFIPLEIRKRNGRPRIVAPNTQRSEPDQRQQPHILRAIGRAWSWHRKLESGEVSTIHELAKAEGVTDRFISRMMRLAYLSPEYLERLVVMVQMNELSLKTLMQTVDKTWIEQVNLYNNPNKLKSI